MSKIKKVKKALNKLESKGKPKDIAKYLTKKGYKGRVEGTFTCPVARYLNDKVGGAFQVDDDDVKVVGSYTLVPTPPSVASFIIAFDEKKYPKLIEI